MLPLEPAPARRARLVLVTGPPGTGKSAVADFLAGRLGAAVLAHDWAMSGLRPYREVQRALDSMAPTGHRTVGWSILTALARAQLRAGRPVVLDGVARAREADECREAARLEGAPVTVVATRCSDPALHRSRVEGRRRDIPDWYELEWEQVEASLTGWEAPVADLLLDAACPWEENQRRLVELLAGLGC